ncbi:beauvericin cluster-specific repressor BEA4 [Penicillium odoratum]|uniref:beauvericin cluster-specific repressor BEA4 n=1 Tax=Penicillium odoratum TaxID=1167516 RepID=UPI002546FC59|nr:beauvericin cluster-specific repressor BEA4 [Penicillium odoratum]KAJ5771945.1 beauvericin cluster-specific repressor BEA4 [Penicillium odoratum]
MHMEAAQSSDRAPCLLLPRPAHMPVEPRNWLHIEKPVKRRAGNPKVRTGCLTCKLRHVKCDEREPVCLRCEKVDAFCQGYSTPQPKRKPESHRLIKRASPRPIVPRATSEPASEQLNLPDRGPYSLLGTPSRDLSSLGLQGNDGIYFDYFRHQVSSNMCGFYTTSMWSGLVIAESFHHDAVRHSILAIGALILTISQTSNLPDRATTSASFLLEKIINSHHRNSLKHHLHAARSFRAEVHDLAASSPRSVLVVTLLLVVFELLQGKLKTADTLMNSSMDLLRENITLFQPASTVTQKVHRDFKEIEHVVPCISVMSHLSHLSDQHHKLPLMKSEPDFFFPRPGRESIHDLFIQWGRFFTFAIIFLGHTIYSELRSIPREQPKRFISQQKQLLSHLENWKSTLSEYFGTSTADQKALRIAHIHWLMLYISINCCLDPTELSCDNFENEYRDLTNQCIDLIQDNISHARPTSVMLGEGLLLPLCTVMRSCRNHEIRMMAVEAVGQLPWSMVAWDLKKLLRGQLNAILMEELDRDRNGLIPPQSRWFWLRDEWNYKTESLERIFVNQQPNENGILDFKVLSVHGDTWPDICLAVGCKGQHLMCRLSKDSSFV